MTQIIQSLSWTHVTLIVAVLFMLIFRKSIANLISRISSIDKFGVKISQTPEAQLEDQKKEEVQQLLRSVGDSIVINQRERAIEDDLKSRKLEVAGDSVTVLIKYLAGTQLLLQFEQIHNLIFGSQIYLLKQLNEVAERGKEEEYIREYFELTKLTYKEELSEWTQDIYLEFLFSRLLITFKNNKYHITNLGGEYLTWIVRNGKSENRPL